MAMIKENCIVLTGAPGSGKSTLLKLLREYGFTCVDEPARKILTEQRALSGRGLPSVDPKLFVELMLLRAISDYLDIPSTSNAVIFDRGVADYIAYASLFNLPLNHIWEAAKCCRANGKVYFAPNWKNIYTTDEERTMTFESSAAMGDHLEHIYQRLGYELVQLPFAEPEERLRFMLQNLASTSVSHELRGKP